MITPTKFDCYNKFHINNILLAERIFFAPFFKVLTCIQVTFWHANRPIVIRHNRRVAQNGTLRFCPKSNNNNGNNNSKSNIFDDSDCPTLIINYQVVELAKKPRSCGASGLKEGQHRSRDAPTCGEVFAVRVYKFCQAPGQRFFGPNQTDMYPGQRASARA